MESEQAAVDHHDANLLGVDARLRNVWRVWIESEQAAVDQDGNLLGMDVRPWNVRRVTV